MRNKETGEFELVVGNGQLLSAFFILVLLLAVTFVMGYVVGQNAPGSAKPQADAAVSAPATSASAEPAPVSQTPAQPPATEAPQTAVTEPAPADAAPQPITKPAQEPAVTPAAAAAAPPQAQESGSYWQVGAWSKPAEPEAMVQALRDKGFPASTRRGPTNLIHVIVGPYHDPKAIADAKTALEKVNIRSLYLIRK